MQGRLENIQALRGAAALIVVIAHLGGLYAVDPSIPKIMVRAGVAGVDIFFVLSGFIMSWITRGAAWSADLRFAANRFWRVLPLYWLLTLPELPWKSIFAYARDGYLFPNWDFYLRSALLIPSFSPGSSLLYPALNPGWTLFYEMAFYLIWFALMLAPRQRLMLYLIIWLVALYTSGWLADASTAWRAFATNTVLFEFALGAGIAEIVTRRNEPFMRPRSAACAIGFAFLLIVLGDRFLHLDWRFVSFGIPAGVILIATLDFQRAGYRAPRVLRFIGDASYAIYLAQAGTIAAVAKILLSVPLAWPAKLLIISASAVLIGVILHLVFERPVMRWRNRVRSEKSFETPIRELS